MYQRLTDIDVLQSYLAKEGIVPSRTSGQNFLISDEVIEAVVAALENAPANVTELGAGTGVLTQALVGSGFQVKAIERDERLTNILQAAIPPKQRDNLEVTQGDLRDIDWTWPTPYALVGNIPYNLSGLILRRTGCLYPLPERVVLLVQKEVGERIMSEPPNMSLLGLSVQLWGEPHLLVTVPPNCFWPQPQVSSQLILIMPKEDRATLQERENILKVAKQFFQGKRKQLGGQLQRLFGLSQAETALLCEGVGVKTTARPQELSLAKWVALSKSVSMRRQGDSP